MANIIDGDLNLEEEEDDFNPAQQDDSDAEEAPVVSRDATRQSGASRQAPAVNDDDDDQELEEEEMEEDEDEEDEEDDEDLEPSRKRRKRQRRNQFIDVEAEVDEEDEEEPEEDDDLPGEEMHPDDLQELPAGADRDDRKHRELDRQRDQQFQMDVEETAARLKERYGRQNRASGAGSAIVPQRLLLPSMSDPRIWRMKCRPGKEREVMADLYRRIIERAASREPILITSAFERSGPNSPMAGNIYVEALKVDDVTKALDGIQHVFMGTKPFMIPLEEMPDLLKTRKTKELEPGMYVRIKRGLYQGDLAQVDEVESNGTDVIVRLVPRLDYGLSEDSGGPDDRLPNGQKRKRVGLSKQRPVPRLFSETEARKRHSRNLTSEGGLSRNHWRYFGKEYVDGFLIDSFRVSALQTEDVNLTLEEVTKFASGGEDGTENLDLAALAASLKGTTAGEFLPGEKVEIFRGEQKGVVGRSVEVYGEVVKVKVDVGHGPLSSQVIEAPMKDLRKLFREGDHVKVIGGSKFTDEVGMVVRAKDDRVTILTDSNQQEITVFSKDLREATDSGGASADSKYALFDLVQLDAATVACVVKVDRESLRVMDQHGEVRSLLPSNISGKIERRNDAVAVDRDGNEIKIEDTIKELSGEGRTGRVLHMHRNFVFARNREQNENAGVWIARQANVVTVAAKGGRATNTGVDLSKMNPTMKSTPLGAPMAPPQQRGRDRLIGKTVKIRVGQNKGLIGIVKDATNDVAKVELHARNKIVAVQKDKLALIDPKTGQVVPDGLGALGLRAPRASAPMPSRTPAYADGFGSMQAGGRTPAYAAAGGGRTPAWRADAGARTPAYVSAGGGGGSNQGYGGASAYGGATNYGGNTAYGGGSSYGGGTSYGGSASWNSGNAGGRTPAYAGGSRTPAYSGGMEAPTPGFSAPTPGAYQDHTTPGLRAYQTPGAYATPGGYPETPGPYNAETPGAGLDDGPRYD